MKKSKTVFHILILAGMFTALLTGCGKNVDKMTVNNTDNKQQSTNEITGKNDVKSSTEIKKANDNITNENNTNTNNTKGSTKMVHLTAAEFKQKVFDYETNKEWMFTGDKPVIIDFYADWCGPCKMVAPVLEELSKEYDGKVQIYKVDTESEQELASVFGIRSIPSILFIPMKGKPQMSMGAMQKEGFIQAINEILLAN